MAGDTPKAALDNFRNPIQKVVSCVSRSAFLLCTTPKSDGGTGSLSVAGPLVPLSSGLSVSLKQQFEVVDAEGERGPWKVSTRSYMYSILADGKELIDYHWHPKGASLIIVPHLHIGPAAGASRRELDKAHIPTVELQWKTLSTSCLKALA